jgi:UPF0755 protein
MKRWRGRLIAALVVFAVLGGAFWLPIYLLAPARKSGPPVSISIPIGANAAEIGRRLRVAGAIRSGLAFTLAAKVMGESKDMKAGDYLIQPGRGVFQIIDQLVAGDAEAQWITIPEGKTLAQIASILESRRLARASEFVRDAQRRPSWYSVELPVKRRSCDGFLMPDTYRFPKQISERQIIKELLKNWNRKVYQPNRELFAQSDLPMEKVVTLASLIEREAKVPQDRELISAVIRNRLKKRMKLQVDATVIYALGRHKSELSFKDLKVKSRYNTYQVVGLPPGPICNPGLASVEAALKPAREEYLYYVAQPDGSHIFTKTAAEHLAAIQKVKQMKATVAAAPARSG